MKIEEFVDELENLIKDADEKKDKHAFQDPAYELLEELEELGDTFGFVEPIFRLIERSPDIDFGAPGPLGFFLEKFYQKGYEEKLLDSLKRKSTEYTIFLLHRLCNDTSNPKVEEYNVLLRSLEK